MNNNGWITDRKPIEHDESYVYDSFGHVCHWIKIANGEPWKPIPKCEPYVWPKYSMDNDIMENENVEIKEMGFVFAEDVAELEQAYSELLEAYSELLEALKAISNLYIEYPNYTALTMAVIANNAIAQSKEKYNE